MIYLILIASIVLYVHGIAFSAGALTRMGITHYKSGADPDPVDMMMIVLYPITWLCIVAYCVLLRPWMRVLNKTMTVFYRLGCGLTALPPEEDQ